MPPPPVPQLPCFVVPLIPPQMAIQPPHIPYFVVVEQCRSSVVVHHYHHPLEMVPYYTLKCITARTII